ncbi:MAG: tyrosine-type recombinase/integrase [Rectinemataceae bacterium]
MEKYHPYPRKMKDKDGKLYRLWYYWYWENGKQIRKTCGGKCYLKRQAAEYIEDLKKKDIENAAAALIVPSSSGAQHGRPVDITLKEFAADLFLSGAQHLRRRAKLDNIEIKETTRQGHRAHLTLYIIPEWGKYRMSQFEDEEFPFAFVDWLVDLGCAEITIKGKTRRKARPMANSTRNAIIETMSIVLREAKRKRLVRIVSKFERFTRTSKSQDTLTDEDLSALFPEDKEKLERIWTPRNYPDPGTGILFAAMCCLGVSAGLRSGEARAIYPDRIIRHYMPETGQMLFGLIVNNAIDANNKIVPLKKATEDDPRTRVVVIPDKTIRILDIYLATIPPSDELLFLYHGKPMGKEQLERRWRRALVNAGINMTNRRLTPHAMRYTYNTRMKMLLPKQVLQDSIGHLSEEMTELYDRPHLEERLLQLSDQRGAFNKFWDRVDDGKVVVI